MSARIAVVRALHLGDLLVVVPTLRALRAGFPSAEITLIGLPWAAGFATRFGAYIDRFLPFPGFPGIVETKPDPERLSGFIAEQRAYGYDLAVQLHGSGATSNAFTLALGAATTAGYYPPDLPPPPGLSMAAPYPDDLPEIDRNLRLMRLLGCPDRGRHLEFPLFEADHTEADRLLARTPPSGYPLIGVHPGAKIAARRWALERFAAVADRLTERHAARIVITGGPEEEPTARAVATAMRHRATVLAGETSLGGLAALIARLDLFISNDTGPAHIACALDTPSVVVFGPADHRRWAPLDAHRHPTVRAEADRIPSKRADGALGQCCLTRVTPEAVLAAAERLLTAPPVAARATSERAHDAALSQGAR